MTTYALNGLGRIGKLALRPLLERGAQIAFINDAVGDSAMHAHLLEFDSIHGRWPAAFEAGEGSISIDSTRIPVTSTRDLKDLPLDRVDVVIDCTGAFKTEAKLAPYFAAGVKKVVVSAPVKDGPTANIVYGVNNDIYDAGTPPDCDSGKLHDELSCTCGESLARRDRHQARLNHNDPRCDQYTNDCGSPRQGFAPCPVGTDQPYPDHNWLCYGDYADLSRVEGQVERPCGAGATFERIHHGLRV